MRRGWIVLVAPLLATGCVRRVVPVTAASGVHYLVGAGYQAGGVWYYPQEDFHYDATGIASVLPAGRAVTADGEVVDGSGMTAAHQTLQLPAVVRVTNLETGLQAVVRVNDRGPASPARVIGLSRRAAELLGMGAGAAARVRVQVEEGPSSALREELQGGPRLVVVAAPRGAVQQEVLAPPPGVRQSARGRSAGVTRVAVVTATGPVEHVPERLPEVVQQVGSAAGRLMITAGMFGQIGYARQVAARLGRIGAEVERVREGRGERYRVRAGPFVSVAGADAALDQAVQAGVTDARIVVE